MIFGSVALRPAPDTVDNTIMYKHWNTDNSHSRDVSSTRHTQAMETVLTYSLAPMDVQVIGKVINHDTAHLWKQPYTHYHAGMKAGENTLDLRLARGTPNRVCLSPHLG
jgi:hypothetical protein